VSAGSRCYQVLTYKPALFMAFAVMLSGGAASGATIYLGAVSYNLFNPPSTFQFEIDNFTGAAALPPDFPG
jgi:hypothetical protein